jgi:hypothetical protein
VPEPAVPLTEEDAEAYRLRAQAAVAMALRGRGASLVSSYCDLPRGEVCVTVAGAPLAGEYRVAYGREYRVAYDRDLDAVVAELFPAPPVETARACHGCGSPAVERGTVRCGACRRRG